MRERDREGGREEIRRKKGTKERRVRKREGGQFADET